MTTLDQINAHLAAIADLARQQQQTIDKLSNPVTPSPQPLQDDGEQSLWTELASIDLTTGEDRGLLRLRGQVLSGYMIGLKVQTRLTATGEWADYLEGPDFDTPNAMMPHSSAFGSNYIAEAAWDTASRSPSTFAGCTRCVFSPSPRRPRPTTPSCRSPTRASDTPCRAPHHGQRQPRINR